MRVSTEADVPGSQCTAIIPYFDSIATRGLSCIVYVVAEFSLPTDYPDVVPLMKLTKNSESLTEQQLKALEEVLNQQVIITIQSM